MFNQDQNRPVDSVETRESRSVMRKLQAYEIEVHFFAVSPVLALSNLRSYREVFFNFAGISF